MKQWEKHTLPNVLGLALSEPFSLNNNQGERIILMPGGAWTVNIKQCIFMFSNTLIVSV